MWRFKGVEYTINEKTKDCSKTRLTKEFIPLQVEDGAKWEGDFTIGAPQIKGGSLECTVWSLETTKSQWTGTFTRTGCIPVRIRQSVSGDDRTFITEDYYDVVAGITDPSVFVPPRECPP